MKRIVYDLQPQDLKQARISSGYTNAKATAKLLEIAPSMLYHIEAGTKTASYKTLFKMCNLYKIELRVTPESAATWGYADLFA